MRPEGRSRGCVKRHIPGLEDVDVCRFGCGGDVDAAWLGMRATRDADVDPAWMWTRVGGGCGCGLGVDVDACLHGNNDDRAGRRSSLKLKACQGFHRSSQTIGILGCYTLLVSQTYPIPFVRLIAQATQAETTEPGE
jgi:hypothetical protein